MSEQTTTPVVPAWELPDRLRRALRHTGVGSNEMAEYLEVSRHTISNWINGHTQPPATAVKLWAMRCAVPYSWLAHGIVADDGVIAPRSDHRLRHLRRDLAPVATTQEILALRKELHGDRRGSTARRLLAAP